MAFHTNSNPEPNWLYDTEKYLHYVLSLIQMSTQLISIVTSD